MPAKRRAVDGAAGLGEMYGIAIVDLGLDDTFGVNLAAVGQYLFPWFMFIFA
jgi:hypothetical protein